MKKIFEHKGKKTSYASDWVGSHLWVHINGKTFVVEGGQENRRGRKKHEAVDHNKVLAPMPGKVTKILISANQVVTKGQPVLVMEAMKMEYTLKAEMDGNIKQVHVQTGAQVTLGQTLIELGEKPA